MIILTLVNFLFAAFLGYIIGRWGDYHLNFLLDDPPTPHHWIYGLVLITTGSFYLGNSLGLWLISFGAGIFVSDLKDFLKLKVWGKDNKTHQTRNFWHID